MSSPGPASKHHFAADGARNFAEVRAVLDRAVVELPVAELPDLLGALASAIARAQLRLLAPAPAPLATDDVVDVATLSTELGLAPSWLRAQARADKLPCLRAGKYVLFKRADVLAALADHRMRPPVRAKKRSNGAAVFPAVSK